MSVVHESFFKNSLYILLLLTLVEESRNHGIICAFILLHKGMSFLHVYFFDRFVAYLLRDAITRRMRAIHNRVILTHLSLRRRLLTVTVLIIKPIILHPMTEVPPTSFHVRQCPQLAQGTIRPPSPLSHTIPIQLTL